MKLFFRWAHLNRSPDVRVERHLRAFAPQNRDGVRKRPRFGLLAIPLRRAWLASGRMFKAAVLHLLRIDNPASLAGHFKCRSPPRRDGRHSFGIVRSKKKRRNPFHGRGRAAKGRSCGFFGQLIAARQSLQSMISRLRLVSKQHSRRAGFWLRLSTSGILSDQKVWDAPVGCFVVLFDVNIRYPFRKRDGLLRFYESDLFRARSTDQIVSE